MGFKRIQGFQKQKRVWGFLEPIVIIEWVDVQIWKGHSNFATDVVGQTNLKMENNKIKTTARTSFSFSDNEKGKVSSLKMKTFQKWNETMENFLQDS